MPEKSGVDWSAVQSDRDAGVKVSELVKKYGVSNPTIYTNTHGSKNGKKAAGGGKNGRAQVRVSASSSPISNGGLTTIDLIAALRRRRDALSAAIAALEGSEGS